ncbi:ATP-binding protein [Gimesia aquarii]|uniref:histidine kinase n=1 Tax=Gimesia aquarii TaxID=2527964 RepID=A0A517VNY1_9PLAN|nr:ATP-binding protein [Gimesia aquarii]QDT94719.1 Autoinducer 2 sensor kinase/phosphatase LuxQ [Gimesia aquarii]
MKQNQLNNQSIQKQRPFHHLTTKLRKWPISNRLKIAFGLLVLVQVVSGLVTFYQISNINQDISRLVNVEEPLEESILEMEIKAGEIARAVLDYVRDRNPKDLSKLNISRNGFTKSHIQYQNLASTKQEKILSQKIGTRYSNYNQMATSITSLVDQRDAALAQFMKQVKHINKLIESERLETNVDTPDGEIVRADASHNMEKYLNIAFGSVEEYIVQRNHSLLSRIFDAEQKFKFFERKYLNSMSDHIEKQRIKDIGNEFEKASVQGNQVMKITIELDQLLASFEQNLDSIDELLHNQAHPLIYAKTVQATHDADSSIRSAKIVISLLAIIGTVFGLFSAWIISRGIVSPILELSESAELIAAGKVEHRIEVDSQDEIGRLSKTFNHMVDDLVIAHQEAEQASHIKSAFLANMSHEIRTPMTAILGFAEIMRQRNEDPETIRHIDTIKKNGEYLLELINDILDVSKIEADKLEVEEIECSLIELIEDVKTLMEIRAIDKGLKLLVRIDGKVPRFILSDPIRLRQILINLLSNAIKFTKQGSVQLVIRTIEEDSKSPCLQFDVIDTGIGMTEEQISRLFQPFAQADSSTTRKYGGTGLGLTICKRLSNILGGEIYINSEYGIGTTFTVTIKMRPISDKESFDDQIFKNEVKKALSKTGTTSDFEMNYNILLAEDGLDNQKLISFLLKKSGAKVTLAENGQIAVNLALEAIEKGNPFDVILMDMQMPELDGYAATKVLRSKGFEYPIIALTAHSTNGAKEECIAAGCNHYATKPINRTQFFTTIQKSITEYREHMGTTH